MCMIIECRRSAYHPLGVKFYNSCRASSASEKIKSDIAYFPPHFTNKYAHQIFLGEKAIEINETSSLLSFNMPCSARRLDSRNAYFSNDYYVLFINKLRYEKFI